MIKLRKYLKISATTFFCFISNPVEADKQAVIVLHTICTKSKKFSSWTKIPLFWIIFLHIHHWLMCIFCLQHELLFKSNIMKFSQNHACSHWTFTTNYGSFQSIYSIQEYCRSHQSVNLANSEKMNLELIDNNWIILCSIHIHYGWKIHIQELLVNGSAFLVLYAECWQIFCRYAIEKKALTY